MTKPEIKKSVKDVVKDIKAGVTDPHLMDKYNLTASQLESLLRRIVSKGLVTQKQLDARISLSDTSITRAFVEVSESIEELDDPTGDYDVTIHVAPPEPKPEPIQQKRKVKAKDLIVDIRAGLTDSQLMKKHHLTSKQLQYLFGRLLDAGQIGELELWQRTSLSDTAITKAFVEDQDSLKAFETTQIYKDGQTMRPVPTDDNKVGKEAVKTFRTGKDI